jgi:ankyrin repeat protein|eukprot:3430474-Prymnesium_polylepis.3
MWTTSSKAADSSGNRLPEDSRLNRALVEAARDGDAACVERLLNSGASPEAGQTSGYTSLGLAVNRGHTDVVELLLARKASPDTPICVNDATPLMISVVWDRRDVMTLLLAHGCSLEPKGTSGSYRNCTALDVARQRGRSAAADIIVRERARRRLNQLRRLSPLVGRFARALNDLYNDIHYRPGGVGEQLARIDFENASSRHASVASPLTLS